MDDLALVRPAVPADLVRGVYRNPHRPLLAVAGTGCLHDALRLIRLLSDAPQAGGTCRGCQSRLVGTHVSDDVPRANWLRRFLPVLGSLDSAAVRSETKAKHGRTASILRPAAKTHHAHVGAQNPR